MPIIKEISVADRMLFELEEMKKRIDLLIDEIIASRKDTDDRKPNGDVKKRMKKIIKAAGRN